MTDSDMSRDLYIDCITKQLEELDMLSSIYCSPGEMNIHDPGVISDFNEFLQTKNADPMTALKAHLDYTIAITLGDDRAAQKLEIRFELPHLYPLLENAIVILHTSLLSKPKELHLKAEIEKFIATLEKSETHVFQVITWIQDHIEELIKRDASEFVTTPTAASEEVLVDFERLWIYSHHIKSKVKRQEIVRQSRNLDLSGFCRPGKPGIICVEGELEHTQEFWRVIKAMRWQKISICKSEVKRVTREKLNEQRRFEGFKEQLFCDSLEDGAGVMNTGAFLKYLEQNKSGYMKKELFGIE